MKNKYQKKENTETAMIRVLIRLQKKENTETTMVRVLIRLQFGLSHGETISVSPSEKEIGFTNRRGFSFFSCADCFIARSASARITITLGRMKLYRVDVCGIKADIMLIIK